MITGLEQILQKKNQSHLKGAPLEGWFFRYIFGSSQNYYLHSVPLCGRFRMLNALLIGVDEKGHKLLCWNWFFLFFPWSSFSWYHWSRLILFMLKIYFESFSRFINTTHCFGRFSFIQARNWFMFLFLDSLMNLLLKFHNFCQPFKLVRNRFNRSYMTSPIL